MSPFNTRVAVAVVVLVAAVTSPSGTRGAPSRLTLTIEMLGLRSAAGQVLVALFSSPEGFPDRHEKATRSAISSIEDGRSVVKIENLAPGIYAVSAVHDANGNRKLDTNWAGIPREGIAFSNDAKATFGPPSFQAASFRLEPGHTLQRLTVRY